jgi:nucleolar protein 56
MARYWFEHLKHGGDADPTGPGGVPNQEPTSAGEKFIPLDWQISVKSGLFRTRQEYLSALRSYCLTLGEQRLSAALQGDVERILRMVRTLDEVNVMIDHFTGRLVDWYSTVDPSFTRKDHLLRERALLARLRKGEEEIFLSCVEEGERLLSLRTVLSREVSRQAETLYPNCSALVGGLVAARLIARAGGLDRLAKMSATTIQVLGAENALFSHLHAGTPPPKHGIIYQHKRVHAAPRDVRGRVARVLAGRLALAARLDYYRKTRDDTFIQESQLRIDRAGVRS